MLHFLKDLSEKQRKYQLVMRYLHHYSLADLLQLVVALLSKGFRRF
jgi:hypothetical protein